MNSEENKVFKLRQRFLALFIILAVIVCFLISYIENRITESYLQHTTQNYTRAYNTIYTQYNELSDVIFTGLLKLSNVKELFYDIKNLNEHEQNKIRKELYKKTIERYKTLQLKHIKSVNFILADNTMFLKVKKPSYFGQEISDKRHTIHYVHENKKHINSYEIGTYGAGFRFAYPIMDKDKYLGIISITFGAEAITTSLMKQYYVLSNFFIDETKFPKDILEKKQHLYKKSHHKGFIFDAKVLKELTKVARADMKQLRPDLEFRKTLNHNMLTNDNPISFYDDKTNMIFTHIPIYHKLTHTKEAILAIRSKFEAIDILQANYLIIHLLMISLIATILFLIYQHNIKLLDEKKLLQESLEKDKQLLEQAKMAQMGEMIGNIAHQWRQPLSTISTAASGVKVNHEFDMLTPEDIPKHMDIILKSVTYLSQTIDTFRDFIKEDASLIEVVLQEKIDKTLDIVSATLNHAHINIINQVDYSKPYHVTLIQGALPQVLINIINNAKDAIQDNNIDNGWIKIAIEEKDSTVIITLEDNGKGIPIEIINRIFDPYFTTKHQNVGTGLGLFMSHKIITEHLKGKIYVENTANGAKFSIQLPLTSHKE